MRSSLLQDYLTRSAEGDANRTALVMGDTRVSYGELERSTNQLAHLLAEHGCRAGERVCLLASKSPATIASMLAVLKAGGIYVPVDSAGPAPRVARILASAEPAVILADPGAAGLVDVLLADGALSGAVPVGSVNGPIVGERFHEVFSPTDAAGLSAETPGCRVGPDDPAHLLFTSGSTGDPKGVVITHRNVSSFVEWAASYFGTRCTDRNSGHPPLHFDLSTLDIYGTLAAGAELHLVPPALGIDPRKLAALIRDSELTQWFSVPSVLTYLARFDVVGQDDFPSLERLLWCGEVLPTPVLAHWMRRLPHVAFTNLYGPTEATIASSYHTVPDCPIDETEPVPIGRACDGEELLVLDDRLQPVPTGEVGDLYIAGSGLSPGYWRDGDKTSAAFLSDPRRPDQRRSSGGRIYRTGDLARTGADGLVTFVGRADSQIKHRGYRIELGEVEAALSTIPGVRECAVVGIDEGGFEGTAICCAYSLADPGLTQVDIRRELSGLLPAYMLPSRWQEQEELPKNRNGKIDRPGLRRGFSSQTAGSPRR